MRRTAALLLALVLLACGDDAAVTTTAPAGFSVEIAGITLDAPPQRIISGSPTHTEILFAIGAGDQVIAVDAFSDFPAEAAALPRLDAFNPSVEGFAALDPDLVVLTFDPGEVVEGLAALGVPALVLDAPVTVEDVYAQILQLGDLTDNRAGAEAVTGSMRSDIASLLETLPEATEPLTYYHELDPTYYSVGSDTFLGSLYGMLGMSSIADAAGGGWPQLSAEFIVEADPDFVFLADTLCCGVTPEAVAERPGWETMTAVRQGRVISVDESLASRWGPRLVEFLEKVAVAVYAGSDA